MTVGFAKTGDGWLAALDNEVIFGRFGGNGNDRARFWLIRFGLEKKMFAHIACRCGLIIPVIARTKKAGNLRADMPFPKFGGTVGVGLDTKQFSLDFAVYGDPARSYVEQKVALSAVITLTLKFDTQPQADAVRE